MLRVGAIVILILDTFLSSGQNKNKYQYEDNIPTKKGIQQYIDLNADRIVKTIESFIGDTINSYHIIVDELSEYMVYDSLESGRFYPEDEIIISNEKKFFDYELSFVPKWKQKQFISNTRFVKGVLIHELIHLYVYQFITECLSKNIPVSNEYLYFNRFPGRNFHSAEFVEEGICEYVVMKLNESIYAEYKLDCLDADNENNIREFKNVQMSHPIRYQYSRSFIQEIFDKYSFQKALLIIVTAKAPTYEELLCPEKYHDRLMKHATSGLLPMI